MPGDSVLIFAHDSAISYSGSPNFPLLEDSIARHYVWQPSEPISFSTEAGHWLFPLGLYLLFVLTIFAVKIYRERPKYVNGVLATEADHRRREYQVFRGSKLNFQTYIIHRILSKYFRYYRNLAEAEQKRFITRLEIFMSSKNFTIPAREGYREMPILISASAIQLTFGLEDFMLPWYENICIHPREYILTNPLRTLAGNVTGKTITLSWKHFFEDYQNQNGVNVGLHEMAHALQMQHEYFYKKKGEDFRKVYDLFESMDEHVRKQEQVAEHHLYSPYALSNTDEFWASSIEIFFEQPLLMQEHYPEVYVIIKTILNQDPARSSYEPCANPYPIKKPGEYRAG